MLQDLAWEAPDWIAVPAGNLGNTSAFGKALREAHEGGWIKRVPLDTYRAQQTAKVLANTDPRDKV